MAIRFINEEARDKEVRRLEDMQARAHENWASMRILDKYDDMIQQTKDAEIVRATWPGALRSPDFISDVEYVLIRQDGGIMCRGILWEHEAKVIAQKHPGIEIEAWVVTRTKIAKY